jgi:hypothetical protein
MSTSCSLCAESDEKNIQKQFWAAMALCTTLWGLLVIGTMLV